MSASAASKALRPWKPSFGQEFEFLVAYMWDDEDDPDEAKASELPPLTKLPIPAPGTSKADSLWNAEEEVHRRMNETLKGGEIPMAENTAGSWNDKDGFKNMFHLTGDGSVCEVHDLRYKWVAVELKTPPRQDLRESFEVNRYVFNLLKSNYRIQVNKSCGYHVHVGMGLRLFPVNAMKRIAGLLWAADPLLSCLHPPERRHNGWVGSMREETDLEDYTHADHWGENDECKRYYGQSVHFGEYSVEWRKNNKSSKDEKEFEKTRQKTPYKPYIGIPGSHYSGSKGSTRNGGGSSSSSSSSSSGTADSKSSNSQEPSPTGGLSAVTTPERVGKEASANKIWESDQKAASLTLSGLLGKLDDPLTTTVRDPPYYKPSRQRTLPKVAYPGPLPKVLDENTTFRGLEKIFSLESACDFALLFSERVNYNLSNMNCQAVKAFRYRVSTVEFREAAGTLDPEWSMIWARIAVGLVSWATHAPLRDYLTVVANCDIGTRNPGSYDVLDLLDHIGLVSEAAYVEKMLHKHAKQWGYIV
ncbi:putative Amidoligase enzyme [Seiridium cardinale]|uniref:Amidoligase enzyme n=1 Tax=Seiridium cardinale TaxID=138064 RepID=A0ABR2XST0_9PEZI